MTIADQIQRLQTAKSSIKTSIENKGVSVPADATLDTYNTYVDEISTGVVPTGNIDITNTNVTNVTNYATAKVVDNNLVAGNIKKDVNILGIVGTLDEGGITPTGTISITENGTVDVTNYASAEVNVAGVSDDSVAKLNAMLGIS